MENRNVACPCKRKSCERHGDCAACRAHHAGDKRQPLTACRRLADKKARDERRMEENGRRAR